MNTSFIRIADCTTLKKKTRKEIRDHFEQQLDAEVQLLKQEIDKSAKIMEEENGKASKSVVEQYVNQVLQYPMDEDELTIIDANIRKEIFEHYDYEKTKKNCKKIKINCWNIGKKMFRDCSKRILLEAAKTLLNYAASDAKKIQDSKTKKNEKEKSLDHMASNETIKYVIDFYQDKIDDAQKKISTYLDEYWREKERDFKNQLILKVTESDTLTDSQREEIALKIQNYDINIFKEQANSVFIREKFIKGTLLGIHIIDDEIAEIQGQIPVSMSYVVSYANGYHLIQAYLKRTGNSINEATVTSKEEILEAAKDFSQ